MSEFILKKVSSTMFTAKEAQITAHKIMLEKSEPEIKRITKVLEYLINKKVQRGLTAFYLTLSLKNNLSIWTEITIDNYFKKLGYKISFPTNSYYENNKYKRYICVDWSNPIEEAKKPEEYPVSSQLLGNPVKKKTFWDRFK